MTPRDHLLALMAPKGIRSFIRGKLFTLAGGRAVASLALIVLLAIPWFPSGDITLGLSTRLWDTIHRHYPRKPEKFPVVIIDIDRASLVKIGQWPWPRSKLAQLIEKISAMGPSAIGIDIMMPEKDRLSPEMIATSSEIDQRTREFLLLLQPNDERLAEKMEQVRVIIGRVGDGGSSPENNREERLPYKKQSFIATGVQLDGPAPDQFLYQYSGMLLNVPVLESAAFGHSLLNSVHDKDGVLRRMPLISMVQNKVVPSLALEVYRASIRGARFANFYTVKSTDKGVEGIQLDNQFIETDPDGSIQPYFSVKNVNRKISALDIFHDLVEKKSIENNIVLIGVTALGLTDVRSIPPETQMDGVEIQAQVIENLVEQVRLKRPEPVGWIESGFLLIGGLLLIILVPIIAPLYATGLYMTVAVATLLTTFIGFQQHYLIASVYPLLGITLVFLLLLNSIWADSDASRRALAQNLWDERLSTERIRGELDAAHDIQMGSLPDTRKIKGLPLSLELHSLLVPAKEVGGDFYDVFMIDQNRLFFVIADVSGKGVPASLFSALSKALCKSAAMRGEVDLSDLIRTVNLEISRENSGQLFVTAILGVIDGESGILDFCNAGHEHPLLLGSNQNVVTLVSEGGPPLCSLEGYVYPVERIQLQSGETVVIITDGATDAIDANEEIYGINRLRASLGQARKIDDVETTVLSLHLDIETFSKGVEQTDDMAILGIRYHG